MKTTDNTKKLTFKDFKSDQEVRWCAGCGDHAILNNLQKAMAKAGEHIPKENFVVISGIGCSSRLPYYMDTYGFHSIHGRALPIASGVKMANRDLSVWVGTGDGDSLAIGGNHFIHAIRRNMDLNIIMFNNEIYGLTKGQYSPTSEEGFKSKTSPYGTIEAPFNPAFLVLGARGTFFARSVDANMSLTQEMMVAAEQHKGAAVVEVLQNCVIFNDKVHSYYTDREHKADRQLILKHGEKMIFGKDKNQGLVLDGFKIKKVTIGENGVTEDDILTHDAYSDNPLLHTMLAEMGGPDLPIAFGLIRAIKADSYDQKMMVQIEEQKAQSNIKCMNDLLFSGGVWEVK